MRVVGSELIMPAELSRIGIERNDRSCIEIVAGPDTPQQIRRRISRSPVDEIQLGIIGPGQPRRAPAMLPGVAGPGFTAGGAGFGNCPEAPVPLAGFRVEGIDETASPFIGAADSHNDLVLYDEWCHGGVISAFVIVHDRLPNHTAG